jgi:2-methylcitrate dehydratase
MSNSIKKEDLQNFQIARFALGTAYEEIGGKNIDQLKKHLLDAIGSMVNASRAETIRKLTASLEVLGKGNKCKAPILKQMSYDKAAQLYTALIRYPDFMDNFMGKEATCHPSDNIGALLAVSQMQPTSGKDFLAAMAIAYQIECRLVQEIPVMIEGIDHTLLLAYSVTAACGRLAGLNEKQLAHALGIAGSSISPMVTSRASYTFEWKGLASSLDAMNCTGIVVMAKEGLTGPIAIFEGPKGFKEVFDMKLDYQWDKEQFTLIERCCLKRYNAEVHSQSALEALDELRKENAFDINEVTEVEITTFFTAYHIIGSGAYGNRQIVKTKEQADHSLFYLAAALLLDGELYPDQFNTERIESEDVQTLLKKVKVKTVNPLHKPIKIMGALDPYTAAYPDQMKCKVEISLANGEKLSKEKDDYFGFHTKPFDWEYTIEKFRRLCTGIIDESLQNQLIATIQELDQIDDMSTLIDLICKI